MVATEEGSRCLSMCKVDALISRRSGGRKGCRKGCRIESSTLPAKGSWGSWPREVRRVHGLRGTARKAQPEPGTSKLQSVWYWDGPGGFWGSSFWEVTGSESRTLRTESQRNCIETKGSGVDDSPSKIDEEVQERGNGG